MGKIKLDTIKIYAYHGCLEEESIIGSDYNIDIIVSANLSKASISDNLSDTVDYVCINRIVTQEMHIKSKLLEHVAKRISDRIFAEISIVAEVKISVSKINPPIGGDVKMVTITLKEKRS